MIDGLIQVETLEFHDHRGVLSFAEAEEHIPFPIKRLFWIYDIKEGMSRGGHAHIKCKQAIIAVKGTFDIYITDLQEETTIRMDKPNQIIIINEGIWCELKNFSADAVVLVATSEHFDREDYLQPMSEYSQWVELNKSNA
ncbi:MAG: FdtA/QdtA family cupin domain-containing protein [Bacteroidaceae bacterium]|nr:FdtA/QdtA family cupin domain-containing protein [Bacteroidaceae bacterium]